MFNSSKNNTPIVFLNYEFGDAIGTTKLNHYLSRCLNYHMNNDEDPHI